MKFILPLFLVALTGCAINRRVIQSKIQDMPPSPTVSNSEILKTEMLKTAASLQPAPVKVTLSVQPWISGTFYDCEGNLTNGWQPLNFMPTNSLTLTSTLATDFFRFQAVAWPQHFVCDPITDTNIIGVNLYAGDGEKFTFPRTNDFVFCTTNNSATNFYATTIEPWPNPNPSMDAQGEVDESQASNTVTHTNPMPHVCVMLATN